MIVRGKLFTVALHVLVLQVVQAFNFTFLTIPAQCEELSIQISGGVPPYRLLIIPIGQLLTPPEIRTIIDRNITGTRDSFIFNYPAASRFVAMMSDATGIGTGGTSAIVAVGGTGTKSDCLQSSVSAPQFYLFLDPSQLTQCGAANISWGPGPGGDPVGQVSIYNIVIGGQSSAFNIPSGATHIDWTTNIRTNTTVMFVAGDSRGPGTGGSTELLTIGSGSSSCIDSSSPSSTQQPPAGGINTAGGSTPTSAPSSGGGSGNVGAIVGGVIGGVAGIVILLLVLLFFYRRHKHRQNSGTRPMKPDLIDPSEDRQHTGDDRPGLYEPEPFIMPPPDIDLETSSRHSLYTANDGARPSMSNTAPGGHARAPSRLSVTTASEFGGIPPSSQGTRKSGLPPTAFRPVNFVQHDDGGEVVPDNQEPETIELPPAYTDFRGKVTEASGSGAGGSGSGGDTGAMAEPPAATEPPTSSSAAAAT
ncbi:SKG6 domain protein [Rhizoctonia solani 123E]|uniref:SKG6 domain protein n=1 Tax=Rhizoctonia solani 123E TaxID=1423351 RepID=A0A074RQT7_9AGAM|nr:SKG6 domain protein [Rhizoctonia solani 123E]